MRSRLSGEAEQTVLSYMNSGRLPEKFRGPFTCVRLGVDSAKQAARTACRRFPPENHPFKDKLRAARRLDPDQKNYLRNDIIPSRPRRLRLGLRDDWLLFLWFSSGFPLVFFRFSWV